MKTGAIIFLWIIHISALIGIALGYEDFFLPKSPLTLIYLFVILIAFFPVNNVKLAALFASCFVTGMLVEWIGVHTGSLFGEYHYGINLGPKLDGIPVLIGVNWSILVLISHRISQQFFSNIFVKSAVGAGLMVLLDYFLEQICDFAGFWHFTNGAGWYNYLCWFAIGFGLHVLAIKLKVKGDLTVSVHLYAVQLIFSALLWLIITI